MIDRFPRCYDYGYCCIIFTALQMSKAMCEGMLILFVLLVHPRSTTAAAVVIITALKDHLE